MIGCGNKWKFYRYKQTMSSFFFSGSSQTKVDDKNRFVLPQQMRYGLVENGSISIYRKSDMDKIVKAFQKKQHSAKYQKFMTLFFSTLHQLSCDKLGRVVMPTSLKKAAGIEGEIVICGVLNRIEVWSAAKYEENLGVFLKKQDPSLAEMAQEAFALLDDSETTQEPLAPLTKEEKAEYQEL